MSEILLLCDATLLLYVDILTIEIVVLNFVDCPNNNKVAASACVKLQLHYKENTGQL